MHVLVTGSKGFTGKYLLPELKRSGIQVTEFYGNLLDKLNIEKQINYHKPDAIIHLAGISFIPDGESVDVYQVNTLATELLLQTAVKNHYVKRIILASSSTIYGKNINPKEDDCPSPINHYGISKFAMEQIAKNYQDDLEIIITRPFNYTGIGQAQQFLIPKLIWHFQQRKKLIELGNINIARDFSDVRWISEIYVQLLLHPNATGAYNLCSGEKLSLAYILKHLEKRCQYIPQYVINPDFVRKKDILEQQGHNEKLKQLLSKNSPHHFFDTLDWMLLNK